MGEYEQITGKDIGGGILNIWSILKKRFIVLVLITIFGALLAGILTSRISTKYTHKLQFTLSESDGGTGGAMSAVAAQFGLSSLGGGKSTNPNKVRAIAQSRTILEKVLKDTLDTEKNILMLNAIIKVYPPDQWLERFTDSSDIRYIEEEKINRNLKKLIFGGKNGKGLVTMGYDRDTEILDIESETIDTLLGYNLTLSIYKHLATYYTTKSVEPQLKAYELAKIKSDSLKIRLDQLTRSLGKFSDSRKQILSSQYLSQKTNIERELSLTNLVYAKAIESKSITELQLQSNEPVFSIVELPYREGDANTPSIILNSILGAIFVGIFSLLIFVGIELLNPRTNNSTDSKTF